MREAAGRCGAARRGGAGEEPGTLRGRGARSLGRRGWRSGGLTAAAAAATGEGGGREAG